MNRFSIALLLLSDNPFATGKMDGSFIAALTITGLAVVFSALILLVVFLSLSGFLFHRVTASKSSAQTKPAAKPAASPARSVQPAAKASAAKSASDETVVAVITAAIAAMGAADGVSYRVRSVKPVRRGDSGRSAWAQAGLHDNTAPF